MSNKIEETVDRAISGIVYGIWGSVGFRTSYYKEENEFNLIVWNKSYKYDDKKEVVNKRFKIDFSDLENKVIHDLIYQVEKYLLENYS